MTLRKEIPFVGLRWWVEWRREGVFEDRKFKIVHSFLLCKETELEETEI